ncbi:MAG: hypothetical protein K2X04_00695 [Burkholderiales bacterium]|nr:hypothetical protein [Burkholderiales bacterium]
MKITSNHPLAHHGLIVGEQINHNGISYNVMSDDFGVYNLEAERLCSWKKKHSS